MGIFSLDVVQLEFDTMRTKPEGQKREAARAETKRARAGWCLVNMEKWVFLILLVMSIFEVVNAASGDPMHKRENMMKGKGRTFSDS